MLITIDFCFIYLYYHSCFWYTIKFIRKGGKPFLACPLFIKRTNALLYLSIDFCATFDDTFRDMYELLRIR